MMRDHDDVHDEELRHTAQRLGAAAADRLDVERTAQAVLARLRAGDAPARGPIRWMRPAWLRAAAVVVVIIGAGVLYRTVMVRPDSRGAVAVDSGLPANPEFADVTPGQLQDVLRGLDETVEMTPTVHAGEAGVEDLSEPQLQSLLKAMED